MTPLLENSIENLLKAKDYFATKDASWMHFKAGQEYKGGNSATAIVSLDQLAMFKRTNAKSPSFSVAVSR